MKLLAALIVVLDLVAIISGAPSLIHPAIGASIGLIVFGPLGSQKEAAMVQHRLYMTHDWNEEHGAYLAVITTGHPRMGDDQCEVLTVELLPSPHACRQWFKRMRRERPWETRS